MTFDPTALSSTNQQHQLGLRRSRLSRRRVFGLAGATAGVLATGGLAAARQGSPVATAADWREQHWVGAWAVAPRLAQNTTGEPEYEPIELTDRTYRQIARPTIGGEVVRVRLTNAHTDEKMTVAAAHLAVVDTDAGIVAETDRVLTFGGRPEITLPPDAVVVSDPVELTVTALEDLAVSLYLPGTATVAPAGLSQAYASPEGDFTGEADLPVETPVGSLVLLSGIDVGLPQPARAIVTLGDSITDGVGSTPGTFQSWPDFLARRLVDSGQPAPAVLNAGIGGNRILNDGLGDGRYAFGISALARFDRDVLTQPGATHVIVLEGINDIGLPVVAASFGAEVPADQQVTAEDVIAGLDILAARTHAHGLPIYGGTLTPIGGSFYDVPEIAEKRQAINDWIRTSGAFDAVIDFDAALSDPDVPLAMLPDYDSGDMLHPNDAGYLAMAEAIDLALFQDAG